MSENIISFPGGKENDESLNPAANAEGRISEAGSGQMGIPGLTADQEKALQVVMSGMSFVLVGIKPTDTGADFFTAIDGNADELRNAADHIAGVVDRLYTKRGL